MVQGSEAGKRRRAARAAMAAAGVLLAALCGAYWFATGGLPRRGQRPAWLVAAPIAHRGLWSADDARPENSLAAFEAAAAAGVPIELDVHATADGQVVVMHDDTLERMTSDPRRVADVTLAELRKLRLLGTNQGVPTLAEVLRKVDGRTPVFIEIKDRGEPGPLEDAVLREIDGYAGKVAVMSFNPLTLAYVAQRAPGIARGQLSGRFAGEEGLALYKRFLLRHLLMNWRSRPDFVAYEIDALPAADVMLQRTRGRYLIGWAAGDPATFRRAERLCDAVMFDPGGGPALPDRGVVVL